MSAIVTYFSLLRYYEQKIDSAHLRKEKAKMDRSDFDRITESIRRVLDIDMCHIISLNDGNPIILSSSNERYYGIGNTDSNRKLFAFSQMMISGIGPIPYKERNNNIRTISDIIHFGSDGESLSDEKSSENKSIWLIDNTVGLSCVKYNQKESMDVLIIRLSPNNATIDTYLVALMNADDDVGLFNRVKLLTKVINVVFLKSKLWRLIDACYESLYSSQMQFDYITHISKDANCLVYHISDLHVSSLSFKRQQELLDRQNGWVDLTPDLLLITGDICTGALTAYEIESNYDFAAKIIKQFVSLFWCVEESRDGGSYQYLRSDWKKRIVFCPGNHDYAIMNELKAISKHRETTGGEPIDVSGGPAAKFTYYVNALRKHFDIIDAHIDDKLNFVRLYAKIGAVIVSLNSCSEANSNLQNKAHVDFDQANNMRRKMDALLESKIQTKSPALIVMAHHSYKYFPNYLNDKYPFPDNKRDNRILDIINEFNLEKNIDEKLAVPFNEFVTKRQEAEQIKRDLSKKAYCDLVAYLIAILFKLRFSESSMEGFRKVAFDLYAKAYDIRSDGGNFDNRIEEYYSKEIDELIENVKEILSIYGTKNGFIELGGLLNEIIADRFYIKESSSVVRANEADSRILLHVNRICSDIEESVADYRALKEVGRIFTENRNNMHWLSGHVHEGADPNEGGLVHEANKFFRLDGNGSINYYKLVYNRDNANGIYCHTELIPGGKKGE